MTCSKAEKRRKRRSGGSGGGGSGGRFRIFKCFFWPMVKDEEAVHKAGEGGPAFIVEKGCALPLDMDPLASPLADGSRVEKKGGRLGFSASFKSVFLDSSLGKRSRKSKFSEESDESLKGKSFSTEVSEFSDSTSRSLRKTNSSISGSSRSIDPSRYSSLSMSSRSCDYGRRASPHSFLSSQRLRSFKEGTSQSCYGLRVFVVTLLAVVLWGKVCGIICTSTWLYIMNHRAVSPLPLASNGCDAMDSAEYKKRIILGGFLDRKRSRSLTRLQDH